MGNKNRGDCELESGGKVYTLRYSTNALCEVEAILEKPFDQVLLDFASGKISMINTRAMFYSGLREHHPDLTITESGNLLDEVGLDQAVNKLNEAISLAFPAKSDSKKKEIPPK